MPLDYLPALTRQLDAMRAREAAGMPRRGWKVGINVPEVQRRVGLTHSLGAWLDGDQVLQSGATYDIAYGSRMHVEPEACLRLASPVSPKMSVVEARAAVEAVAPALELVDYSKPADDMASLIEHGMYHCGCVLGAFWAPRDPASALAVSELSLQVGIEESEPVREGLVPEDPGELLLGLSRVLAEVGEELRAGDLVLTGSFTMHAVPIGPSQVAKAEIGDLGSVQLRTA